jgi:transcription elongation GreA/GreB family factor
MRPELLTAVALDNSASIQPARSLFISWGKTVQISEATSVQAAHEAATHEENVAENKYDTLGLEAAYLATGQARRAEAIRQVMANWRQFRPRPYDPSKGIQLGALVCLVDSDDRQQQFFLGPDGGSMKLVSGAQFVQVISAEAPLGRAMLGKCEGDEVSIQIAPTRQQFEVLRVQ